MYYVGWAVTLVEMKATEEDQDMASTDLHGPHF
jgi:hypothetical protein